MNEYEVEINKGAINRTPSENEILYVRGNRTDLMEELNDNYVDCVDGIDDKLLSFEDWVKIYEATADYGGSTVVLRILENGKEIYKNSEYEEFTSLECKVEESLEDEDDEDYEDDEDEDEDVLEYLLNYIKTLAHKGKSFNVTIDPYSDGSMEEFYIDGNDYKK